MPVETESDRAVCRMVSVAASSERT